MSHLERPGVITVPPTNPRHHDQSTRPGRDGQGGPAGFSGRPLNPSLIRRVMLFFNRIGDRGREKYLRGISPDRADRA